MRTLPSSDPRRNYVLLGALWQSGLGARQLANTTMETYEQTPHKSCVDCHTGDFRDGTLMRMFRAISPLFPAH
jgi:hypothetical protein